MTLTPADNYADNNYIHHIGVFYKQGVGIALDGVGNRASHNLIHDGPRMGIMFSGNNLRHRVQPHPPREPGDRGHRRGLHRRARLDLLARHGRSATTTSTTSSASARKNGKWVSPHFAWGVYLDDNTGGVDVIGNIVARARGRACTCTTGATT